MSFMPPLSVLPHPKDLPSPVRQNHTNLPLVIFLQLHPVRKIVKVKERCDLSTDKNHILADRYGRLLRKIAAYIMVSKASLQPYQAARAALFYLLS